MQLDDQSLLASGDNPEHDTYSVHYKLPAGRITAIKLETLLHESLPRHGPGRGYMRDDGTFLLSEINVKVCEQDRAKGAPATEIELVDPKASFAVESVGEAIDGDKLTGWHIKGGAGRGHCAVFEFAEPITVVAERELSITLLQNFIHQQTIGRFRIWISSRDGPFPAIYTPPEVVQVLVQPRDEWSAQEARLVKRHYLSVAPELAEARKPIETLRRKLPEQPTTLVLEERDVLRPTHEHIRGEFSRPGKRVTPAVPRFLHPLPEGGSRNRLALARWLLSAENPLVARVIVNQIWQCYFGRGLVDTPEDFGTQGSLPSHPELLDWLSCYFMESGWDLKQLHRLIVTSATYRQASTPRDSDADPENVLLSRGPRARLYAEAIRDVALRVSGLLEPHIGGPSVFPAQPEGAETGAFGKPKWTTSSGTDRYRRGLYTHRKRATPYAAFATFDAPPNHTCAMGRIRSNTPLQALVQLNDETLVQASRALARRVVATEPNNDLERFDLAFQLCLTRLPTPDERETLLEYAQAQLQRFQSEPERAAIVAGSSADANSASQATAELATWTLVSRILLNLDETITKQ
jgi:hypothetical protein